MRVIGWLILCAACSSGELWQGSRRSEAALAAETRSSPCSVPNLRIEEDGLGPIRVGQTVAQLRAACTVVQDTVILGDEAIPQRMVLVRVLNDTVSVVVENDRVWRIEIDSRNFLTPDSLGVGTPLRELLQEGATGAEGEGMLYVQTPSHCGVSFRVDYIPNELEHRQDWRKSDLELLPPGVTIDRVLIFGCAREGDHRPTTR